MLLFVCLMVLLALLCTLWRKPFEQALAPFVCALILIAYAMAMFQGLQGLVWLVGLGVLGGLIALGVQIAKVGGGELLRSFGRNVCTPGLLCFAILVALFYLGSRSHTVTATDDIYYWGIEARSIFAHHGLVDAVRHLSPRFMTYTPGMQLFQWVGLTIHGEWSESVLYMTLWVFYAVFLLPLCQGITWKKAYGIPVFVLLAALLPPLMNGDAYQMLRVDTALGVCLGYALIQAWSLRKPGKDAGFHLLCFSLSLCVLVLIKQIGVGWAAMAMALLLVCRPIKAGAARPGKVLLACAAPLFVSGSWLVFSAMNGLSGVHLNSTFARAGDMLQGAWAAPEGFHDLPASIWRVLSLSANRLSVETSRWLDLPKLAWVGLFAAIPLLLIFAYREQKRTLGALALWVVGCFAVFLGGYVFVFMTSLYGEAMGFEGKWAFGYYLTERYFCPFLISLAMLFTHSVPGLLRGGETSGPWPGRLALGAMLALLLLCTDWQAASRDLSWEAVPAYAQDGALEGLAMENIWLDELEDKENAIVFYGIESYPFKLEWLQYVAAPAKLVLTPETELSKEAFLSILSRLHVTHIVCMDESNPVYLNALDYTEDEWLDVLTLYRVDWEGETPALSYE